MAINAEEPVASTRPEDEKLGIGANLAYGLQHVLTMYGGIVAVPLILGQAAGLDPGEIGLLITASLFAGGLATILQTIGLPFFGSQLPLVQGVSFSGVATMIVFGSFTQSAFAQNVGLVAVTGVKSRYVVAMGGLFLVTLGLLPVMGRIVAAVPSSVLGGAGIVLFGTVAASGIRTLSKVDYVNNMNLVIVATSIGFGMIPIASPTFYEHFPAWVETIFHSGISSAALMAISLNLIFNHMTAGNSDQQSVFVAGTERTLRYQDIARLHDGDYFLNGKLYDAKGIEVPVIAAEAH
ncbi:hypothetical protein GOC61_05525 [Sinorhizobium medicae]|nr:hypothetical protein [Sinorhizobium medicae]MDX1055602.1 hypothetical protein [Sinorhizobium medicae]